MRHDLGSGAKKIDTPYHATLDADFEILNAKFVPIMLARLDNDPDLIAISTDYTPTVRDHYDSYSNAVICLNERWHTWFCVYKREALQCQVSHAYHEEVGRRPVRRTAWDTSGYFQRALKHDYGFDLAVLIQVSTLLYPLQRIQQKPQYKRAECRPVPSLANSSEKRLIRPG